MGITAAPCVCAWDRNVRRSVFLKWKVCNEKWKQIQVLAVLGLGRDGDINQKEATISRADIK